MRVIWWPCWGQPILIAFIWKSWRRLIVVCSVVFDGMWHQSHKGLIEDINLMTPVYLCLLLLTLLISHGLNVRSCGPVPLLYLLRPYLCLYSMFSKTLNNLLLLGLGVTHSDLHASRPSPHPRDVICLRLHLDYMVLWEEVLLEIHVIQVLRQGFQIESQDLNILVIERQVLQVLEISWHAIMRYIDSGHTLRFHFYTIDSEG